VAAKAIGGLVDIDEVRTRAVQKVAGDHGVGVDVTVGIGAAEPKIGVGVSEPDEAPAAAIVDGGPCALALEQALIAGA
jgi:hypothetical protein